MKHLIRLLAEHDDGWVNPKADHTWQERMDNRYKGKPRKSNSLPPGTFTLSPGQMVNTLKNKSEDYGQAASRLNQYINRQGRNLEGADRARLDNAKKALDQAYGEHTDQTASSILFNNDNATVGYDEQEINPIEGDPDIPDSPFIGVNGSAELPVMPVPGVHNFDDGYLKTGLDEPYIQHPEEGVRDMAVPLNAAARLLEAEKWSSDVDTKKHPPEGKFSEGSAEEIASWAKSSHKGDLGKAIQSISFYLNRGGKNLSDEQRGKVEHAKEILEKENAR